MKNERRLEASGGRPPCSSYACAGHQLIRQIDLNSSGDGGFDSGRAAIDYATSTPDNYTPSYAYPLIVWFHDDGLNELDVSRWLPRISPQNYLGIGLRAPVPAEGVPGTFRWSLGTEHLAWLEEDVAATLGEVCSETSVHPERIVAAGIGAGGTIALQMLLRRPEWFAGAAALNAAMPDRWRFDHWGGYVGRCVWLGGSELLRRPVGSPALLAAKSFHTAGFDVTRRFYSTDQWPLDPFVRELDHWLMRSLCADTVVA